MSQIPFWYSQRSTYTPQPSVFNAFVDVNAPCKHLTERLSKCWSWVISNRSLFDATVSFSSAAPEAGARIKAICRAANRTRLGRRLKPSGVRFCNVVPFREGESWSVFWALEKEDHALHIVAELFSYFHIKEYSYRFTIAVPHQKRAARKAIERFLEYWRCNAAAIVNNATLAPVWGMEPYGLAEFNVRCSSLDVMLSSLWLVFVVGAVDWRSIRFSKSFVMESFPDSMERPTDWVVYEQQRNRCKRVTLFGTACKDSRYKDLTLL